MRLTHHEAAKLCIDHSFQIFEDGTSPLETAYLFRGAKLIIGPHGAGLSNIIFANPMLNPGIIELTLEAENALVNYARMAVYLGLKYYNVGTPGGGYRYGKAAWTINVNVDEVVATVDQALVDRGQRTQLTERMKYRVKLQLVNVGFCKVK